MEAVSGTFILHPEIFTEQSASEMCHDSFAGVGTLTFTLVRRFPAKTGVERCYDGGGAHGSVD
jgi:hypothetical protein